MIVGTCFKARLGEAVRIQALQNLALNVAEKGFPISVYNRSYEKTEAAVSRAGKEGATWALTYGVASDLRGRRTLLTRRELTLCMRAFIAPVSAIPCSIDRCRGGQAAVWVQGLEGLCGFLGAPQVNGMLSSQLPA